MLQESGRVVETAAGDEASLLDCATKVEAGVLMEGEREEGEVSPVAPERIPKRRGLAIAGLLHPPHPNDSAQYPTEIRDHRLIKLKSFVGSMHLTAYRCETLRIC